MRFESNIKFGEWKREKNMFRMKKINSRLFFC